MFGNRGASAITGSLILLLGLFAGGPVPAQENADKNSGDRFVIQRMGEGYIRLDRQTGATSFCQVRTGGLSCTLASEDREAFEGNIARLEGRIRAVEEQLAKPEREIGEQAPEAKPEVERPGDDDAALEKSLNFAERALRRFFSVIKELKDDLEKGASG